MITQKEVFVKTKNTGNKSERIFLRKHLNLCNFCITVAKSKCYYCKSTYSYAILFLLYTTFEREIHMATDYLDIQTPAGSEKLVRQDLKFKTGKFVWRIKFTAPLNPSTVNTNNLFVTTAAGNLLNAYISYKPETNCIEISPAAAYSATEQYTLHITTRVQSRGGQSLKEPVQIKFKFK